jgi:hypothetical protein
VLNCGGSTVSTKCLTDFALAQVDISVFHKGPKNCVPDTSAPNRSEGNAKMNAIVVRIVAWLKKHSEFSNKPEFVGLSATMQALYPCQ